MCTGVCCVHVHMLIYVVCVMCDMNVLVCACVCVTCYVLVYGGCTRMHGVETVVCACLYGMCKFMSACHVVCACLCGVWRVYVHLCGHVCLCTYVHTCGPEQHQSGQQGLVHEGSLEVLVSLVWVPDTWRWGYCVPRPGHLLVPAHPSALVGSRPHPPQPAG